MSEIRNTLNDEETVAVSEESQMLAYESLNEKDRQTVNEYVNQIDIKNTDGVLQFGSEAQAQLTEFSDTILSKVKTTDTGEVGGLLASLVGEIKSMDTLEKPTGIKALFAKVKTSTAKTMAKYDTVSNNIDGIVKELETHKERLCENIKDMDDMYIKNVDYFKQLSIYIIAGEEKLKYYNQTLLPQLQAKAQQTGDQQDVQAVNDTLNLINRFEKKLYDLKLSRTVSLQMGPQIRLIQNNDSMLVEKIQSSVLNTIPLWKSQLIIYLGLANVKRAVEAQQAVSDVTNELLKRNSEMLKTGTIDVAKESERGIIDIETIRKSNADLLETIDTVLTIQKEGKEARKTAEGELAAIENELKAKMLSQRNESI